ncbi:cobalamin biosynthesis protein CbiK [Thermosulfurimonas marina]|uniref:Cobalamin biosynthesis protein CbiK n=1 Tax=Thermosulfurimonas marina TaxID=2047767 RepID=A0A6H1WQS0_9BACT|nr:sirohydrochlorin cobaltochelatase [Thermosulfurimonas marina]QJA05504.1 cobalamin biosynthesis protein CbiK [Thermosulfurimonas marina]
MRRSWALWVGFFLLGFSGMARAGALSYLPLKHPPLKERPALVLCAFGTSTRARVTFDYLEQKVREAFPGYEIRWAFTSSIIREKMNRIYARKGLPQRLYSLHEVLAQLYAAGYRKVVVQPLHVFPGLEYEAVVEVARRFPDLRIVVGEPLLFRWEYVREVLAVVEKEFLPPEEGLNILVAHGTDVTAQGANLTYLGLDWLVRHRYSNVLLGTVEGIPGGEEVLEEAKRYPGKRVRFIPFMLVAGDHIMHDIMGKDQGEEKSWREILEEAGKEVDCVTARINGRVYYRGLGLYPETADFFVKQIRRALEILKNY